MSTVLEPSRIYGYITLVDPVTHQRYLPLWDYDHVGVPSYGGKADFRLTFRSRDGRLVPVDAKEAGIDNNALGVVTDSTGRVIALRYEFRMRQQRGLSGIPSVGFGNHYIMVAYDPDGYQYQSMEIVQFRIKDPNGAIVFNTTRYTAVPLERVPLADLPNF